ncbi:helix-turn-helix domain-containing protein, partial [Achromobacter sp.]
MSILDGVQRVLGLYAEGASELSFTEVAARLSMPKSSASRLLNQMQHYGLLDQDAATRRYRAGTMLAQAVRAGMAATPLDD